MLLLFLACALSACAAPPPAAQAKFLYVPNEITNSISAYAIDANTGALGLVRGSPFATGTQPSAVAVDPSGKFVYVSNTESGDVSGYRVDAGGGLAPVAGSPFAADYKPHGLTIDPGGKFLYAANENLKVSAYAIDGSTGTLKPVAGSPFGNGKQLMEFAQQPSIAIAASGKFAYAFNDGDHNVSVYAISAADGSLKPIQGSPFDVRQGSQTMALDPAGKFLFVADQNNDRISPYAIDPVSGALASAPGSATAWSGGPTSLAVNPSGNVLYAAGESKVFAYSIDPAGGALKPIAGSPFAAGYFAGEITVGPNGNFVYVTNYGSRTVSAYTANATSGALTAIAGSPFKNLGAIRSDPYAQWFDAGKCAALNHLHRGTDGDGLPADSYDIGGFPDEGKLPAAKRVEGVELRIAPQRLNGVYNNSWYYFYDPRAGVAYRHTGGDSNVSYTLRFAGKPPAGVPAADLSGARTKSGLALGASAEAVIATLGQPYVTSKCGFEIYTYLQSPDGEPNEIEFTIRNGRVVEIFATSYG